MALRERSVFARTLASGGASWTVPNFESWLIRNIFSIPSSSDTYLTLYADGVILAKLRTKGKSGNHLPYPGAKTTQVYERRAGTVFDQFLKIGRPLDIPLAAGQTFTVSRYAEAGDVALVYDKYDAGDQKADGINGSAAKVRRYLHYLTNVAAVTATPATLDTSLVPTGWDTWPVAGRQVATNHIIRLLGILAAPSARGNNTINKGYTTYLQLLKEGDLLLDDGLNGIPLGGNSAATADSEDYSGLAAVIGPATGEYPVPGLWLPEPIEFKGGDTLTPQVASSGAASAGIAAAALDVALVLEREVTG
jgi:hypothetical protein